MPLDELQNLRKGNRPAGIVAQRSQEQVDVLGHDDRSMQQHPAAVVMEAVFQYKSAGLRRKRVADELAESHKQRPVALLKVRQTAAVFIGSLAKGDHAVPTLCGVDFASVGLR